MLRDRSDVTALVGLDEYGDEDRAERLPDKCTIRLESGDVLRMLTPGGGGGWGDPTWSNAGTEAGPSRD